MRFALLDAFTEFIINLGVEDDIILKRVEFLPATNNQEEIRIHFRYRGKRYILNYNYSNLDMSVSEKYQIKCDFLGFLVNEYYPLLGLS